MLSRREASGGAFAAAGGLPHLLAVRMILDRGDLGGPEVRVVEDRSVGADEGDPALELARRRAQELGAILRRNARQVAGEMLQLPAEALGDAFRDRLPDDRVGNEDQNDDRRGGEDREERGVSRAQLHRSRLRTPMGSLLRGNGTRAPRPSRSARRRASGGGPGCGRPPSGSRLPRRSPRGAPGWRPG